MEEKLPNDKLEDFLKKSFEDYTESPPGDMWDKIEKGLGATPVPVPKPFVLKGWWLLAAAAVLAGLFLAQHLYFERKIERLTKELGKNFPETQEQQTSEPESHQSQTFPPKQNQAHVPQSSNLQAETAPAEMPATTPVSPKFSPKTKTGTTQPPAVAFDHFSKKQTTANGQAITEKRTDEVVETFENFISTSQSGFLENTPLENQISDSNPDPARQLMVPAFLNTPFTNITSTYPTILQPTLVQPSIDPVRQHGFVAGMRMLPMATWEQITKVEPAKFPNRPGRPEKFFNNQQQVSGLAFALGATLEYKTSNRLSLVSGLDYLRTETSGSHRSEFRFKDRKPHGGGGNHPEHDFSYNLNTSSGLVEVDVRVEATNPGQQVPDTAMLAFVVNTNKTISQLSLPLAVKYSFGKGRLHGYVKGGLAVNFLLNESFDITEVKSLSDRFRVSPGGPKRGQPQSLKTVTTNYLAAAGLEYDLTGSLRLNLEPTFMGSLGSPHSARFIQSSNFLAGVSLGLGYVF